MTTNYPGSLDNNLSIPKVTDLVSPIRARDHNNLQEAIIAIETELGANPSGTAGSVKDRFDDLDNTLATGLQANLINIIDVDGYFTGDNVEEALNQIGASLSILTNNIGEAEDGVYSDGLFTDFSPNTPIGTAIDRFNEVLGSLSPPPAPALSDIDFDTSLGTAGKVSFGSSNAIAGYSNVSTNGGGSALDINDTFTSSSGSSLRKGIYAAGTNKTGALAEAIVADTGSPNPAYPANAFGDGYSGTLQLELNGSVIHSIDLTIFGFGNDLNGNGSGFQNVSAGTPLSFPNGDTFDLFYYRTANWIVNSADERNGWNYARVIHTSSTFTRSTNYFEWVVDANTTATSFSGETLDSLSMSGSNHLSGVEYHTGGSAQYDITISNVHRNTYSNSASAVSYSTTNCSVSSSALGSISSEADDEVITNAAVTVSPDSNNRILNGSITVATQADRTVQSDLTSSGDSIAGILVDSNSDNSTATNETLNGEDYRVPSNRSLTDTTGFTSGGAGLWDSTISLVSATAGYSDGLIVVGSSLYYPSNASVPNSGNFSTIANGPAGNPDYSSATGAREYWRYFYFSSATSNFVLNLNGTGTVVNAGSVSSSTDEFSVEMLLPNTTQDGVGSVEFKDCSVAFTDIDSDGCYASTYGSNVGDVSGANWGLTAGSRNTATAGNAVIIKIIAGQGWTGNITNISLAAA